MLSAVETPTAVQRRQQHSQCWRGHRVQAIAFSFADCPLCKVPIDHPSLQELLEPIRTLQVGRGGCNNVLPCALTVSVSGEPR